jgi:hypothetical protein
VRDDFVVIEDDRESELNLSSASTLNAVAMPVWHGGFVFWSEIGSHALVTVRALVALCLH